MNPLNGLLLGLAVVSYFLRDLRAAVVIAVMAVLAIGTAFIQEHRSTNTTEKLRAMVKHTASVQRRGAAANAEKGGFEGVTEILLAPGTERRSSVCQGLPWRSRLSLPNCSGAFGRSSCESSSAPFPASSTAKPSPSKHRRKRGADFHVIIDDKDVPTVFIAIDNVT